MSNQKVSLMAVKAMAGLIGMPVADKKAEELLPQLQRATDMIGGLDNLGLRSIEPSLTFCADLE